MSLRKIIVLMAEIYCAKVAKMQGINMLNSEVFTRILT